MNVLPSLSFFPRPLDHSLWWAIEEDEFGVHVLLQVQLPRLSDQENVRAELQYAVHVWQLLKHDFVGDAAEELAHKLSDDQDNRGIQTHDAAGEKERGNQSQKLKRCSEVTAKRKEKTAAMTWIDGDNVSAWSRPDLTYRITPRKECFKKKEVVIISFHHLTNCSEKAKEKSN